MVFDPFSALGAVGVSLGILDFLTGTIENIDKKITSYIDCRETLRGYKTRLHICHDSLKAWLDIWATDHVLRPYSSADYEDFWGIAGFEQISLIMDNILRTQRKIGRDLRYGQSRKRKQTIQDAPTPQEWARWTEYIETHRPQFAGRADPDKVYKIAYAIYRQGAISGRLDYLEDYIRQLEKLSRTHFWRAQQNRDVDQAVASATARKTHLLRAGARELSRWLGTLQRATEQVFPETQVQWAIILGQPDLVTTLSTMQNSQQTRVDFLLRNGQQCCIRSIDVPGLYSMPPPEKRDDRPLASRTPERDIAGRKLTLLEELAKMVKAYSIFDEVSSATVTQSYRISSVKDIFVAEQQRLPMEVRAQIARKLVHTVILLQGTAWVEGVCICSIGLAKSESFKDLEILTKSRHGSMQCTLFTDSFQGRKFLLLALSLSALALESAVRIVSDAEDKHVFEYNGARVDRSLLLVEVLKATASSHYKDAVARCFEFDDDWKGLVASQHNLERWCEDIVQP